MSDLAQIDPAIKDAKQQQPQQQERPAPVSVLAQPLLTVGEDVLPQPDVNVIVKTSDNIRAVIPKNIAAKLPFVTGDASEFDFPFPVFTLQAVYQWAEKYGAKGASPIPTGPNTFIEFGALVGTTAADQGEWDKQFYAKYLKKEDDGERFIYLINAAEKYGMEGLLSFTITAFAVELRGEADETALKMFHTAGKPTADETAAAAKAYPWYAALTRPTA